MVRKEETAIRRKINRRMIRRTNLVGIFYTTLMLYAIMQGLWVAVPVLAWVLFEQAARLKAHLILKEMIDAGVDIL